MLAHLSDLHFGSIEQATLEPLRSRLAALRPDLVVVSGDLTQRARGRQFREARAFLDSLPRPRLVVPGNHDVPLYNVLARFLAPLRGYRRNIAAEEEPAYVDDEIAVLGVNTARSLVFKGGRVSERQLARVAREFRNPHRVRIVVSHHACEQLQRPPVDVLMSGHLHDSRTSSRGTVLVQAGTATSTRRRDEANSFNVLRVDGDRVEVEEQVFNGVAFVGAGCSTFVRKGHRWVGNGHQ